MKLKEASYGWGEIAINPWVMKSLAILLGVSFAVSGATPISEPFYEQADAATYQDFTDSADIKDYAKPYINYLVDDSVQGIKGYTDGSFKPLGTVTRLEFLSMCIHSCATDSQIQEVLDKAKNTEDYYNGERMSRYDAIVGKYSDKGLYQWGDSSKELIIVAQFIALDTGEASSTSANPWGEPITREYAASTMVGVYEYFMNNDNELTIDPNIDTIKPADGWGINSSAAKKLYTLGVLHGDDAGKFNGKSNLNRADCAVMVAMLRNQDFRQVPDLTKVETTTETTTAVTPGILDLNDPNRRDAVAGDTIVVNGQTIVLTEKFGVVGAEQPVAVDIGRKAANGKTVKDHSVVTLPGRVSDAYIVSPEGEGHFLEDWRDMAEGYCDSVTNPVKGKTYTFGLGGWCKITWQGLTFTVEVPDWLPY